MSAAQVLPDFTGTGLDAGPRPVWIPSHNPKSPHLVHPRYLARAHTREELSAVVTQNGAPIEQAGETLTVGLVPPWRRYAIGPVIDGRAELLSQDDFAREHRAVYEDSFRFRGESMDDPDKRFIPNVRAFVSVKIDTMNPTRICPLGTHTKPQEVKRGNQAYDAAKDAFVERQVDEAEERLRSEIAEKDARLQALEAKVNELVGRTVDATARDGSKASELVEMKCGKHIKPQYATSHKRLCKRGCSDVASA